jgi:hypothetical protein
MTFSGTIIRGDDVDITVIVTDASTGDVVDLSGLTGATFKMKEKLSGAVIVTKTLGSGVTVVDAPEGELKVRLSTSDTEDFNPKRHYFEVEILDASGLKSTVRDTDGALGQLNVLEDL